MTATRRSDIAGQGTFADRTVAAGEQALELDHPVADVDDFGTINHSCDPNLGFAGDQALIALRDIPEGTELTVDYTTAIDRPDWVLWCHCETYRCRQVVEGTDWQIPQLQQRYAGRFTPSVQRRIDGAG